MSKKMFIKMNSNGNGFVNGPEEYPVRKHVRRHFLAREVLQAGAVTGLKASNKPISQFSQTEPALDQNPAEYLEKKKR